MIQPIESSDPREAIRATKGQNLHSVESMGAILNLLSEVLFTALIAAEHWRDEDWSARDKLDIMDALFDQIYDCLHDPSVR